MTERERVGVLVSSGYGKTDFKVMIRKVARERFEFIELVIDLFFEGDFEDVYSSGDNSTILPTDSMRQHALRLANENGFDDPGTFGETLLIRIMDSMPAARIGNAVLSVQTWGYEKDSSLETLVRRKSQFETTVRRSREGHTQIGGSCQMQLMRLTGSSFAGFLRDDFTVQSESKDRILAGRLDANWLYLKRPKDCIIAHKSLRSFLIDTFSKVRSRSAQETIYEMGQRALNDIGELEEISLTFNASPIDRIDLGAIGIDRATEVWSITSAPIGVSQATIRRRN